MRVTPIVLITILALSLGACAQAVPGTELPVASESPSMETPMPLPQETSMPTLPVLVPEDPDSTVVSPGLPGEETPPANPWDPQPGDAALEMGGVFINGKTLVVMESFPPQYMLTLEGDLPTPCNMLRVKVGEPDANGQIAVEAYSVIDNSMACIQVLSPFTANIPLGSFADATYTVVLNGETVGEIGQ